MAPLTRISQVRATRPPGRLPNRGVVRDYRRALRVSDELGQRGVLWLEEPLARYDFDTLARLREATRMQRGKRGKEERSVTDQPNSPGPARPQETLTAWARLLFGAERAEQIAPSLAERIGHLDQISRASLGYDDEPATRYRPPGPAPEGPGS